MNPQRLDKPVIAITGASGLIGTRLVDAFADEHNVVALDVEALPIEREGVGWIRCDLTNSDAVSAALDRLKDNYGEKAAAKAGAWVKDKLASEDDAPFIKPWMIDLADQNYPISVQRAREHLDWEPQHTLRDTLPDMIGRLHFDPKVWFEKNGLPIPKQVEEYASEGAAK